jgi:hypothetical protein
MVVRLEGEVGCGRDVVLGHVISSAGCACRR